MRLDVPERAITTWLVLDLSASMAFGTGRRLKSDVAEGVAEAIGRVAVRRGGRVALVASGEDRPRVLAPCGGRGALAALRRRLAEGVVADGAATAGLGGLADSRRAPRRARAGSWSSSRTCATTAGTRPLRRLAARHTVVAIEVVDPFEAALPDAGRLVLVDPERGRLVEADTSSPKLRAAYAAAEARRREEIAAGLRRAQAAHVVLATDRDWLRDLGAALR